MFKNGFCYSEQRDIEIAKPSDVSLTVEDPFLEEDDDSTNPSNARQGLHEIDLN